jgi:hypothetical protein
MGLQPKPYQRDSTCYCRCPRACLCFHALCVCGICLFPRCSLGMGLSVCLSVPPSSSRIWRVFPYPFPPAFVVLRSPQDLGTVFELASQRGWVGLGPLSITDLSMNHLYQERGKEIITYPEGKAGRCCVPTYYVRRVCITPYHFCYSYPLPRFPRLLPMSTLALVWEVGNIAEI